MRLQPLLTTAAAVLSLAAVAGAAQAQNVNAAPTYGEFRLSPGFQPDPGLLSVRAGGSIAAEDAFSGCSGYIAAAPDLRLYWDGKGNLSLIISAVSNADTTLIVNGPDGRWYCDDDNGDDSNPSVRLTPVAGRYEIWVGTYASGESKPAVVSVSELSSF